METPDAGNGPYSGPVLEPEKKSLFDQTSLLIIGGFILASLIVIGIMYPSYRFARDGALSDKYYNTKEYAKAIPYLERVLKKYPDAWMRRRMLADSYLLMPPPADPAKAQAQYQAAQENYQKVIDDKGYQESYATAPTADKINLDLNEELGICAYYLKDGKKAQEYFAKALSVEPDSPAANYFTGVQYLTINNVRLASRCFQLAATGAREAELNTKLPEAERYQEASRWGDHWDKLAQTYRDQIAKAVLGAPLPVVSTPPKPAGKG